MVNFVGYTDYKWQSVCLFQMVIAKKFDKRNRKFVNLFISLLLEDCLHFEIYFSHCIPPIKPAPLDLPRQTAEDSSLDLSLRDIHEVQQSQTEKIIRLHA